MGTIGKHAKAIKIIFAILAGWIGCHTTAMGQEAPVIIQSRVTDERKAPIEYANVVWLSLPDSVFIQGTISKSDGHFAMEVGRKEKGILRISCVGYATLHLSIDEHQQIPEELILTADTQQLGEVVVKGNPPKTQIKGSSLLTSVAGTLLEKAGTTEDLLNRVPGLSADGGLVNVFGRGTAEVYINGRKVRDHTELDRLASDNIKSVEVINSPGARYAASVKAVVRITTKRIQGDGFGFNTRTNVFYNKEWGLLEQIGFNYRTGGFDLTGTLTGSDRRDWSKKDLIQQTRLDKQWRQEAYMDEKEHNQQLHSTLSVNYVFSPKHAIGARYNFTRLPGYDSWGILNSDVYQDNQPEEQLASRYDSRDQQSKHLLNLYYKGQINDWEMDFNADMLQSKNRSYNHTHESIQTGATESTQRVNTHSEADNRLYAGKLVLSRSIAGGDFSIGGEYVRTLHQNEFNNAEAILKVANSEIRENSLSTFMEYSRNFGPLYLQAGIRFEHITSDYYEEGIKSGTQSKHYNHWLPSATAMLPIGKVQLSLSYTSNILRPTYHELRPNVVYNNRYTYESGNPLLRPQLSQNLILNAIYHQIQFTAGYVHTRDAIVTASSLYAPDTPTIALLTTVNAPAYDNVFASLSYSPTIRFWSPQFTASLFQQGFRTDTPEGKRTLDTPLVNLSWDNSLQLPHHFLINADLSWHSTGHSENTEIVRSSWSAQLTFFKSWMNNRLSCQFRIHDLFNSTRTHTLTYLGALQTLDTRLPAQSRSVSLTVRYKFNAAKNKYKGTGAGEAQKSRM